jgi:hypothetical protein
MVDTVKSVADLQALLADNVSGDISAQDLRDFLVSALGIYGSLSCYEAAVEQVDPDTGAKLTCFTANGNSAGMTPDHTDDSIAASVAGNYDIAFQASFSGTSSSEIRFRLRIDGVEQSFGCTRKLGTAGDIGSASFLAPGVTLAVGEKITVWVEADGATDDLTVADAQLTARMVG